MVPGHPSVQGLERGAPLVLRFVLLTVEDVVAVGLWFPTSRAYVGGEEFSLFQFFADRDPSRQPLGCPQFELGGRRLISLVQGLPSWGRSLSVHIMFLLPVLLRRGGVDQFECCLFRPLGESFSAMPHAPFVLSVGQVKVRSLCILDCKPVYVEIQYFAPLSSAIALL
jgi:hypothetical protein